MQGHNMVDAADRAAATHAATQRDEQSTVVDATGSLTPEVTRRPDAGMVSVEYAIGAVMVIVMVVVVMAALKGGFMTEVVEDFVRFLFKTIMGQFT